MRKELDEYLCTKYPIIFQNRNASPSTTCMYWGFCCGDGWFNLIDALCASIHNYIDNNYKVIDQTIEWNRKVNDTSYEWPYDHIHRSEREIPAKVAQVVANQVKEKFGGLRFYYSGGDNYIRGLVDMAESISYRTCEVCGALGETVSLGGWYSTRCEAHQK